MWIYLAVRSLFFVGIGGLALVGAASVTAAVGFCTGHLDASDVVWLLATLQERWDWAVGVLTAWISLTKLRYAVPALVSYLIRRAAAKAALADARFNAAVFRAVEIITGGKAIEAE